MTHFVFGVQSSSVTFGMFSFHESRSVFFSSHKQRRIGPCIHYHSLLVISSQSPRQLGIPPGGEARLAEMPSNSNWDASCKLTVSWGVGNTQIHSPHFTTFHQVEGCGASYASSHQVDHFHFAHRAEDGTTKKTDGECSKWFKLMVFGGFVWFEPSPSSNRGTPFFAPEVKVIWILWSWQRVSWSWSTLRRVSVEHCANETNRTPSFHL